MKTRDVMTHGVVAIDRMQRCWTGTGQPRHRWLELLAGTGADGVKDVEDLLTGVEPMSGTILSTPV